MKMLFITALVFGLFDSDANAKIGETVDECIARYGKPINTIRGNLGWFRKTSYFIECWFEDGKCDRIIFRRVGAKDIKTAPQARKELESMSLDEVTEIVESMDPGKAGRWKVTEFENKGSGFRAVWRAGLARAHYDDRDGPGTLGITSSEYAERWNRSMEESAEKERGFLR